MLKITTSRFVQIILLTVCIVGVTSSVTPIGQKSVNGTWGSDITLKWNVTYDSFSGLLSCEIFANSTTLTRLMVIVLTDAPSKGDVDKFLLDGDVQNTTYANLANRMEATYRQLEVGDGNNFAEVRLVISTLQLDDDTSIVLRCKPGPVLSTTLLSVYYGAEVCGEDLTNSYTLTKQEGLNITVTLCGKPRPNIIWEINEPQETVNTFIEVINEKEWKFNYTIFIPDFTSCGKKTLNYSAYGYGNALLSKSAILSSECEEDKDDDKEKISDGTCAGLIIGFEIGFIILGVILLVYLLKWKSGGESSKTIIFIVLLALGLAAMIACAAVYGSMRKDKKNDNCDIAFIVFGVIDAVLLVVVIVVGVMRGTGGSTNKTTDSPEKVADETTALNKDNPKGEQAMKESGTRSAANE